MHLVKAYFYWKWTVFLIIATVFSGSLAWSGPNTQYYRYTNERGLTVINDSIAPEDVSRGYDIITSDGTLIRSVPRQLSEQELREQTSEQTRERLRLEEEQRLQAWDEMLMLRYSSVGDIRAAEERAVRNLQIRISILRSNLMSIKSQIEREQQKAADIERSGEDVPQNLADVIEKLGREVEDTEESIAVRRQGVEETRASYERDIERFELLMDRVKLRQQ